MLVGLVSDAKWQCFKFWYAQKAEFKLGFKIEDICKWFKGNSSMWTVQGLKWEWAKFAVGQITWQDRDSATNIPYCMQLEVTSS